MAYRVAICDDDARDAEYVRRILECWARRYKYPIRIEIFPSSESFLFRYDEDKDWDILLLDIEMGPMDGITLAKRLRQSNDSVQIIFITGFPDHICEGYEVAALHYLLKPVKEDKLFSVLDRAVNALQKADRAILLPLGGETLRLPISRIVYVEAFAHSAAITTTDGTVQVRQSITQLEELLREGFVRCHRSYLVGLRHIARLSKTEVILDSGKALPLSRTAAPLVHKEFIRYYTGEVHETV